MNRGDVSWLITRFILMMAADVLIIMSTAAYTTLIFGLALVITKDPLKAIVCVPVPLLSGFMANRWFRSVVTPKFLPEIFEKKE